MAFQQSAFQGDAFQQAIPEPPEPPEPTTTTGGYFPPLPQLRRSGTVRLLISVSGTASVVYDDELLRRRVRAYLAGLVDA